MAQTTVKTEPVSKVEGRFNRFENKQTFWRHAQNGTLDRFHAEYENAVNRMRGKLGETLPLVIGGDEVRPGATLTWNSPADRDLAVCHAASGTRRHVRDALAAAKEGFATWGTTPWQRRCEVLERAADLFTEHFYDLCASMTFETGKSRFEASIDVDEAIDFLRFYAFTMRETNGFRQQMGKPVPEEDCRSVRRPYGVFAVLCPFNFPVAITTGMTAAALVTGNTVLLKPSPKGCLSGHKVFSLLKEAGVPDGALHFLTGPDEEVAAELIENEGVDGICFTGSKKVGMHIIETVARQGRPKPVVTEMGGKNPVIVTRNADLEKAAEGCFNAAFGFSGQKCSAGSRVYVDHDVKEDFLARLAKKATEANVGEPWKRETFLGPVIEDHKADLVVELAEQARKDGGTVVAGGKRVDLNGNYVRPTVVTDLPLDHRVFREEFFAPFVAVAGVDGLDQGIEEANRVQYGLTAGIMSEDPEEVEAFFEKIQAGVVYANRAKGACTAAVVNGQSFGGWKCSGNTGNGAGGRYYLTQFTREQSRTVVK